MRTIEIASFHPEKSVNLIGAVLARLTSFERILFSYARAEWGVVAAEVTNFS